MEKEIDPQTIIGLSCEEVLKIRKKEGLNEIKKPKNKQFFGLLLRSLCEPMFLLLIVCATLYLFFGNKTESILLLSFILIIIFITIHQEYKSENALEALLNLASPRAYVIRDGKAERIAGRELVPGDYIIINEGDRIPADAVLISATNLLIDEANLTGESLPARKKTVENAFAINTINNFELTPCEDNSPFVFSSTFVIQGRGIAKVLAIGVNTFIGKIGKQLETIKSERTLLQKEADLLVRNFAIFGFAICLFAALFYGASRQNWLQGFLSGIALAMAILPEELPVVLAVFLSLGAWRISLKKVLTRQTPAIEALGSTTVLCVDKTGTLTQNMMAVKKLFANDECYAIKANYQYQDLPEKFHLLLEFSMLASQRDPYDPMEIAIKNLIENTLKNTEHIHNNWQLIHQYPLSKELLAISLVWQSYANKDYVIAAKGAPETIFDLCHLSENNIKYLTQKTLKLAEEGLRVLGVARASFEHRILPIAQHDFDFEFLGLIGLSDPIRPNVKEAVQDCYRAGLRIIMLTGDYAKTAQNVAREISLKNQEAFITGNELAKMPDFELMEKIKKTNICARIMPDQKLRLVNALKANGEIVAMTGDGINDTLALKSAHIGIAMGKRGTDVARESAALVLLDDDFSSLVAAIKLGRRIFDNIKKAVTYLFAVHLPIIGLSLLPIALKWPLILLPAHIVFLQLIIDPTCAIVFEAQDAEENIMRRPPRKPNARLLDRKTYLLSILQGLSVFAAATVVLFVAKYMQASEEAARAMTFTTLVLSNLALILANLSWRFSYAKFLRIKNRALWWVIIGAILLLAGIIYVPFLQKLFHFAPLSFCQLMLSFSLSIVVTFVLKIIAIKYKP